MQRREQGCLFTRLGEPRSSFSFHCPALVNYLFNGARFQRQRKLLKFPRNRMTAAAQEHADTHAAHFSEGPESGTSPGREGPHQSDRQSPGARRASHKSLAPAGCLVPRREPRPLPCSHAVRVGVPPPRPPHGTSSPGPPAPGLRVCQLFPDTQARDLRATHSLPGTPCAAPLPPHPAGTW